MARAMMRIRGTYALAVMFKDYPEEIFVARQDNPMIIGVGEGESFIAVSYTHLSSRSSFSKRTR